MSRLVVINNLARRYGSFSISLKHFPSVFDLAVITLMTPPMYKLKSSRESLLANSLALRHIEKLSCTQITLYHLLQNAQITAKRGLTLLSIPNTFKMLLLTKVTRHPFGCFLLTTTFSFTDSRSYVCYMSSLYSGLQQNVKRQVLITAWQSMTQYEQIQDSNEP